MEPEYRPLIPPKHKGATRPNRMVGSYERKKVERGLLTPDVHKKIVDAVKTGNHLNVAAQYAGVTAAALYNWLNIGRGPQAHFERNTRYRNLASDVDQALAQAEVQAVLHWRSAMGKDWHASQKWLEVYHPERWRPKTDAERLSNPTPNISITMQQGMIGGNGQPQIATKSLIELIEENPQQFGAALKAVNAALNVVEGEYTEVNAPESVDSPQAGHKAVEVDDYDDAADRIAGLLPEFTSDH
jgi:hypothetical protein